jgi:hypothetical protein
MDDLEKICSSSKIVGLGVRELRENNEARETADERIERLRKRSEKKMSDRLRENCNERIERIQKDIERRRQRVARESVEERSERLWRDAERKRMKNKVYDLTGEFEVSMSTVGLMLYCWFCARGTRFTFVSFFVGQRDALERCMSEWSIWSKNFAGSGSIMYQRIYRW